MTNIYEVIIIGGGASGLMCAATTSKKKCSTLLLEHNNSFGKKILISGGGRCNFTNINTSYANFVSENTNFSKSALANYTANDFIELVNKHSIEFYEKKLGQLFCTQSAKNILNLLITECENNNAILKCNVSIKEVIQNDNKFTVKTNKETFTCSNLVIASGGLSIPKIGASDFGYKIAKQFGHKVTKLFPALDGFRLDKELDFFKDLAGNSFECTITTQDQMSFKESILFTHKGLSGPVSLQASLHWKVNESIYINLLPSINLFEAIKQIKQGSKPVRIKKILTPHLPNKFIECFLNYYSIENKSPQEMSIKEIIKIDKLFHRWEIFPHSTIGYNKAEVTRGGVSTKELSSKTMESKLCKGLYFIGEVVDVTGWLGGFNFQWAWSSAFAAGMNIAHSNDQ